MKSPNVIPLVEEIRKVMPSIPKRVNGRLTAPVWPFPPLVLERSRLGKVNLYDFMDITEGNFDEIRGLWEEYIYIYVAKLEDSVVLEPRGFLVQRLGLAGRNTEWFLPPGRINDDCETLAMLLAVASIKCGVEIDFAGGGAVLRHNGVEIGIAPDGKVLSKFVKSHELPPFDYRGMLTSDGHTSKKQMVVSAGLYTFYREAGAIEDPETRETVLLALRLLHFRYGDKGRLADYLYQRPSARSVRRWVSKAITELYSYPNPMPVIYEQLVKSGLVEPAEFEAMFGKDVAWKDKAITERVDTDTISDWFQTIKRTRS